MELTPHPGKSRLEGTVPHFIPAILSPILRSRVPLAGALLAASFAINSLHAGIREEDPGAATRVRIHNPWGSVWVSGWSRPLVRIELVENAGAADSNVTRSIDSASFTRDGTDLVISTAFEHEADMILKSRTRTSWERSGRRVDLRVKLPENLALEIRASGTGGATLEEWVGGGSVDIRTSAGRIEVKKVRLNSLAATCVGCRIEVAHYTGSGRLFSGSRSADSISAEQKEPEGGGDIILQDVAASTFFVETAEGAIRGEKLSGRQTCIARQGDILLKGVSGALEFSAGGQGRVEIRGLSGFASGRTASGPIELEAQEWRFEDAAIFESNEGAISLRFPSTLSAELDLMSASGRTEVAFADIAGARMSAKQEKIQPERGFNGWLRNLSQRFWTLGAEILGLREPVSSQPDSVSQSEEVGPLPPGRFIGEVGDAAQGRGGVIRVRTGGGSISVLRSLPPGGKSSRK